MPNRTSSRAEERGRRIPFGGPYGLALGACAVVAAASMALPYVPVFDPWAWLVWGRELFGGDLDTSAGPSWKPLPVLIATPLAAFGDAAPDLWLAIARFGWLAVPVLAWRLAARIERGRAGVVAGALAALGVLLIYDPATSWVRQFTGGLSEPLLAALVLAAITDWVDGRIGRAGVWWLGAALIRPEAWPFAAAFAWREAREGRLRAGLAVAGALLVPALWFVPDLLASGDALAGAGRARVGGGISDALSSLWRGAGLVPVALWAGAALAALALARRRHTGFDPAERLAGLLLGGALAWIALVFVLTAAGFAGLPRFMLPAAVVLCVVGAVGLVQGVAALAARVEPTAAHRGLAAVAAVAFALIALGDVGLRVERVHGELARSDRFAHQVDELAALAGEHGDALRACLPVRTSGLLSQTALAWHLDLPLRDVPWLAKRERPASGIAVIEEDGMTTIAERRAARDGELIAQEGRWSAYRLSACDASAAAGTLVAGVSGARR